MQCSLEQNSMDKLYGITDSITLFYVLPCLTYDNKTRNDHVEEKKQSPPADLHSVSDIRIRSITAHVFYLIPFARNSNQFPFSIFHKFRIVGLICLLYQIQTITIICPGTKLQLAVLLIKREIFNVDFARAKQDYRSKPEVSAIIANFYLLLKSLQGPVRASICAGEDYNILVVKWIPLLPHTLCSL